LRSLESHASHGGKLCYSGEHFDFFLEKKKVRKNEYLARDILLKIRLMSPAFNSIKTSVSILERNVFYKE